MLRTQKPLLRVLVSRFLQPIDAPSHTVTLDAAVIGCDRIGDDATRNLWQDYTELQGMLVAYRINRLAMEWHHFKKHPLDAIPSLQQIPYELLALALIYVSSWWSARGRTFETLEVPSL